MSRAEFLAVWANHTAEADKLWEGLLVSANSTSGSSDISAASALALFNASRPASLLDHSWNGTQLWRQAIQGDATARTALGADFTLTERQVGMVCSWLNTSFYEHYTLPNVTSLCTHPISTSTAL
jgi:anti-sigma-K factor RskA